jgi:ABC-2 type transport system permease protein
MSRILLVSRREFLTNVRRRSFLFTAFVLPLIIIAAQIAIGHFVQQQSETTGSLGRIGYVDLTPDQILESALGKPEEFEAYSDPEVARSDLVAGKIGAYFVVPSDYVEQGLVHAYGIRDVPRGIEEQMSSFLAKNLLSDWPPERAARLMDPGNLTIATLDGESEIKSDESAMATILLPIIFAMVLIMSIMTTSGFLLQGVVEEKETRLVEILVTSITPVQMLWGKIIGLGALGLIQVTVWGIAGWLFLSRGSSVWSALENASVPAQLLILAPIYLLLGYLLFGSLLAGLGASVTSMQEGQQVSSIVSLIAASPLFFTIAFFKNANGLVPTVLSLFPLTAPIAMVLRLPFAEVPPWQIALSLALLVVTAILIVWIAAQIFRVGLLMYSRRLGFDSLWNALRFGLDFVPEQDEDSI